MPETPNGLFYPTLGNDADVPLYIQTLAEGVDAAYGAVVASIAALPLTGDFVGQRVFVTGTKETVVWGGTTWRSASPGIVADFASLPATGYTGQRLLLESTGETAIWNGARWTGVRRTHNPSMTALPATTTGSYVRNGDWITGEFEITATSAGSSAVIQASLPDEGPTGIAGAIGSAVMYDSSGGSVTTRRGVTIMRSGTTMVFVVNNLTSNATASAGATAIPWSWASGDTIFGQYSYRCAAL